MASNIAIASVFIAYTAIKFIVNMQSLIGNFDVRIAHQVKRMKHARIIRRSCYSLAVLFILSGLFCLLWVVSSSSMAFADCNGTYSFFAENIRCRQPPIAGLLSCASFLVAVILFVIGRKLRS